MDPIKILPREVMESVMEFLNPKDILNCFLVSQDWKSAFELSKKCMAKLTLKLYGRVIKNFSDEEKQNLLEWQKFSRVIIKYATEDLPFVQDVMRSSFNWKFVSIYCTEFESTSDFIKFVKTFELTTEEFKLSHVKIQNFEIDDVKFNFKKLNFLSITKCNEEISTTILKECSFVASLRLGKFSSQTNLRAIADEIQHLTKLKTLLLSPKFFSVFFEYPADAPSFQLETLNLTNNMSYNDMSTLLVFCGVQENFSRFLQTQARTLKTLKLYGMFVVDAIKVAFRMEKMEKFIFPQLIWFDWSTLDFPLNGSLQVLDISSLDISYEPLINAILRSSPNITGLRIPAMHEHMAIIIMRTNLRSLQYISVTSNYDQSIQEYFPHIKWRMES